jgi:hypothetical protein
MAYVHHSDIRFSGQVRSVTSTMVTYNPDADSARFADSRTVVTNLDGAESKPGERQEQTVKKR